MNVFIFKHFNELFGKLIVTNIQEIPERIAHYHRHNKPIPLHSYVQAGGQYWTVISVEPIKLQDGRLENDDFESRQSQQIIDSEQRRQDAEQRRQITVEQIRSQLTNSLAILLVKYVNSTIRINYHRPDSCDEATLVSITDDFFTAEIRQHLPQRREFVHVPLNQIMQIVDVTGFPPFIAIAQLVIYKNKGAMGIGVSFPI